MGIRSTQSLIHIATFLFLLLIDWSRVLRVIEY